MHKQLGRCHSEATECRCASWELKLSVCGIYNNFVNVIIAANELNFKTVSQHDFVLKEELKISA